MNATAPLLQVVSGHATCLSTDLAQHFGKAHFHVLRDIENLMSLLPDERKSNFGLTFTEVAGPNGSTRKSPAYRITRDGFTLLAMGFTGSKALAFKLAYIDAFNKMEAALQQQAAQPSIEPAQKVRPSYMREPWFVLLASQAQLMLRSALARALGIHPCTLSQVLNGRGHYGRGTVGTSAIEARVWRVFKGPVVSARVGRQQAVRQLTLI